VGQLNYTPDGHEELVARAANMAEEINRTWLKQQRLEPIAIAWTGGAVEARDGRIDGSVAWNIPPDMPPAERLEGLREMVRLTKAQALLLAEKRADGIYVLFETPRGARAWVMPFKPHGDIQLLGPTQVKDNTTCVGLLWKNPAN
jgi:hypothetical protein